MEARTMNFFPKYFSIVLALAGDSTTTSVKSLDFFSLLDFTLADFAFVAAPTFFVVAADVTAAFFVAATTSLPLYTHIFPVIVAFYISVHFHLE